MTAEEASRTCARMAIILAALSVVALVSGEFLRWASFTASALILTRPFAAR